ncbi:MAG: hypothetical protein E6K74_07800, partial [Candidatus Eisenbacteria bacterium]
MSRIAPGRAARAALLALTLLPLHACDRHGSRVVSPSGVVWNRITPPGASEADWPDWRRDSIAFQVRVQGLDRIAVALEDGSGLEIEPESPTAGARNPRWVRPGIVYVEGTDPDSGRLVLIPDTTAVPLGKIYLTPGSLGAGEPDWNPAGDQICFTVRGPNATSQIWRLSLTDTLPIQLTVAPSGNPSGGPQVDRSPKWSPDGSGILMSSNRGGL